MTLTEVARRPNIALELQPKCHNVAALAPSEHTNQQMSG